MDPRTRAKPVVMEKPPRGREMVTREVPATSGDKELYHEGYVDGKLYLVPDRNLEAMRDTINYRIRRKADSRYERDSVENSDKKAFERSQKKLEGILDKLEDLESESTSKETSEEKIKRAEDKGKLEGAPGETSEEEENNEEESSEEESSEEESDSEESDKDDEAEDEEGKKRKSDDKSKAEETEESLKMSGEPQDIGKDRTKDNSSVRDPSTRSNNSGVRSSQDSKHSDTVTVRFLISGHCRKERKPLFIIQRYEGKSPFEPHNSDFTSKKMKGNMEILISGKFYKDSILREVNDVPKYITIKSNNYPIDDQSKVYEERFADIFNIGEFDLEFGGKFIQNPKSQPPTYTPCITFGVEKSSTAANTSSSDYDSTPKTVYTATPINFNPFRRGSEKYHTTYKKNSRQGKCDTYRADCINSTRLKQNSKSNPTQVPSSRIDHGNNEEPKTLIVTVKKRKSSTHSGKFFKRISQIFFPKGK